MPILTVMHPLAVPFLQYVIFKQSKLLQDGRGKGKDEELFEKKS